MIKVSCNCRKILFFGMVLVSMSENVKAVPSDSTSAPVALELEWSNVGQSCGLGEPPVGKCDLVVGAYCKAIAKCVTSVVGGAKNSSGASNSENKSQALKRSTDGTGILSKSPFSEEMVTYLCIEKYACRDSSSK
jgi:hypothetical protein